MFDPRPNREKLMNTNLTYLERRNMSRISVRML